MIYTLTLNAAVDMNIFSAPLRPAIVNRTQHTEYCPNGKGVNVSLVLQHFATPSHILGIFGGFTGRYIVDQIRLRKIAITPAWVSEPTRINVFIHDGQQEYKLVNPGTWIDDECKQQILDHLSPLQNGDYLVISGSLPPGIESRYYAEIMALCQQKGCEVILDISHPALRQLLEFQPLLIKPNDDELREIFGLRVDSPETLKQAMRTLHQLGARHVLLTLGARGMFFSDGQSQWFCPAPAIALISSACAGDAALAAFLSVWLPGGSVLDALTLASATGADVAGSAGLGLLNRIEHLRTHLKVVTL
ncbi:1-phosphofructokinase [Lelliottia nimipressuralis]|uniref:Phosphofructokinase n=1 Tax=Lelliottia nimipressuralis TaxID=69220 RepID=A0ABY3P8Z2_9ENTR|nr:1-phosphofructokinase [Lelliottia nimipressuralis]RXJ15744.1 1-phosphofructokinase [Lelliottia nimipressuralis]TYT35652.1 1-phosphofructokinase [Lelliottia nimipressuralis]